MTPTGERLFEGLLESAPDAMLVVDRRGRIVLVNGQAERMFGYRRAELVGEPIERLVPARYRGLHRAHRDGFLDRPAHRPMGAGLDLHGVRADGSEMPVDISLGAVGEGEAQLVVAAIRDVTDARRLADEMRRLAHAAERANEAKSEFLSRMSHELRTPLNAIIGFAQVLLLEEQGPGPRREGLDQILAAGRHLLSLINEMLDMARIEAGRIDLSLEPVRLGPVVEQALDLVGNQARERGLELRADRETLRGIVVVADQQRLLQVLVNLLGNAVAYNVDGGLIEVGAVVEGERLVVRVRDTGQGIPAEDVGRIFEPFERLGRHGTAGEGTGLGLALTRRLVEAMGGTIGVSSEVGRGSTFTVELARGPEDTSPPPDTPAGVPGAGPRALLYVEDNLVSQRLVERILERLPGTEVLIAVQGALGIEIARRRRPDLVLLDLHLPDICGEEVLARLKHDPVTRSIPVVVLSAALSRSLERRLLAAGAAAFLAKPFDADVLVAVVDELTRARAG
jgi:protein-histidine pros-kinase